MATRKKREAAVFRVGMSPLSKKIYAGYARGNLWVSNKKDITQSFLQTMIDVLEAHRKEDPLFPYQISDGKNVWFIDMKKVPKRTPKKKSA